MKTYRFYSTPEYYVLVEKLEGKRWLCIQSTKPATMITTKDRVGTIYANGVVDVEEWIKRDTNTFAMEFEAASLEEVNEKIFTYIL